MERISAFMDGEEGDAVAAQVARLKQDPALRERWDTYHLIGDALRGSAHPAADAAFMARFSAALAKEPTVLAPRALPAKRVLPRLALPLAASFGGVALVAWLALSNNPLVNPPTPQGGQQAAAVPAAVKADDGAVKEYLAAHNIARQGIRTVSGNEGDMR